MFKDIIKTIPKEQKSLFLLLFSAIIINTIFELISIASIIPILTLIISEDNFDKFPELMLILNEVGIIFSQIFPNSVSDKNLALLGALIVFLFIFLIKNIFFIFLSYLEATVTFKYNYEITRNLFEKFLRSNFTIHSKENTSFYKQILIEEVNGLTSVVRSFINIATELFVVSAIIVFLIYHQGLEIIILIIFLTLLSLLMYKLTKKKFLKVGNQRLYNLQEKIKYLDETFSLIKDLYITQKFLIFIKKFNTSSENFLNSIRVRSILQSLTKPMFEFIGVFILISAIIFLLSNDKKIGEIFISMGVIFAASYKILPSLKQIISQSQFIKFNLKSTKRVLTQLNSVEYELINNNLDNKKIEFKNNIKIINMSFNYPNSSKKIFKNVNLEIKKNEKIGIVGLSGSGKTTFLNLILTLLNTSEGEIRVDDIKLDSYNKNWLKQIAYVPQEINIIEDNLRNNIALGEESENINNSKIDNLINILDLENLKKEIGENIVQEKGKNISVGQKQRIGIARALYLDPKLLILDEATSSLDEKTESKIVEFLYQYEKNLTILMVTHKEKILYGCDKIFQILNNSLIKK